MKSMTGAKGTTSKNRTSPSFGFGARFVDAFAKDKTNSPGPGYYVV